MRSKLLNVVLFLSLASCEGLQCDADKRASIEHSNKGVEKFKSQSFQDAMKEFEQALQLDPENYEAAYNLGQVAEQQADSKCRQAPGSPECSAMWDKAAGAFESAAKFNGEDAMYMYKLGHAQFEAGKLDQARGSLEKAVQLNKKLFKAHYFLGQIHFRQGRPKDAAIAWSESARLNPGFGKPFFALGKLYYSWDFYAEAVKVLEQGAATTKDPDDRADINYQLGLAYDGLQQWDKAIAAYQKSLEDNSGSMDVKLQLGFSYANKGDKANAKKYLEEYTKSVGQNDQANAFKLMAANSRLMKLLADSAP